MMMILGVSPLRGFPVERRGIGHLVPILCGRRLAGLVRLGGGVCPSAGCPVGTVVQLVGPAPTLHGALGARQASAGYGPASGASVSAYRMYTDWRIIMFVMIRLSDLILSTMLAFL